MGCFLTSLLQFWRKHGFASTFHEALIVMLMSIRKLMLVKSLGVFEIIRMPALHGGGPKPTLDLHMYSTGCTGSHGPGV